MPLTDADKINLHLSKVFHPLLRMLLCYFLTSPIHVFIVHYSNFQTEDKEFIGSLLSLFHNIRRAIHIHEDLSQNVQNPSELITGSFNSIKVLYFP